jgi:hypothetical protein
VARRSFFYAFLFGLGKFLAGLMVMLGFNSKRELNPGIFGGDGLLNVAQLFVVQCSPCVGTLRFIVCISGKLCTFATVFDTDVALVLHSLVLSYLQWIMMYTLGSGAQELFYVFFIWVGQVSCWAIAGACKVLAGLLRAFPSQSLGAQNQGLFC